MAVVNCLTCGRLLYRPDELRGWRWQCPTCGPTVIDEVSQPVPLHLAVQLEAEYRRTLSEPASNVSARAPVAEEPPTNRFAVDPHRWDWLGRLIAAWVTVTIILLGTAALQSQPNRDYWILAATASALVLIVGCVVLAVMGVLFESQRKRLRDAFVEHSDAISDRAFNRLTVTKRNRKEQPGEPSNDAIRLDADPEDRRHVQEKPD